MKDELTNIKNFLQYLISKDETSYTDRIVYTFLVKNPYLHEKALKYIYPDKNDQPNEEAILRLQNFITENISEFDIPDFIKIEEVSFNQVFNAIFL